MSEETILNKINKFWGGIVKGERDKGIGVSQNIEEIDIFSNPDYIEPDTIFGSESATSAVTSITRSGSTATVTTTANHGLTTGDSVTISGANETAYNITATVTVTGNTTFTYTVSGTPATPATGTITATYSTLRKVLGYTKDNADNLYAITRDVSGTPKTQIWILANASADNPTNWTHFSTSITGNANNFSPIIWHVWDSGADYLYYVTGTQALVKLGDLSTATETSVGTLTGLGASDDRIPMIRWDGEVFVGNGQFIAKVDKDGVFKNDAWTAPLGWEVVSFDNVGDELAVLCRNVETGENSSKMFYWDGTATTGFNDAVVIRMGGPQIVVNHNEELRVFCSKNGILRIFQMNGKVPLRTHELSSAGVETATQPVIPDQTKFIKDGILYFGLFKTDKTGLYALGRVEDGKPLALILAKRFDTSDYSLHKPQAAIATGPNFFVAFDDNATSDVKRLEGNNSPTRSSNAIYESIWIDADSAYTIKDWPGFFVISKALPASTTITIDARVDNASSYNSNATKALTNANDQSHDGGTADTFWYREWTSVVGRAIQIKISFTSSGTSKATLFTIGLLSREHPII